VHTLHPHYVTTWGKGSRTVFLVMLGPTTASLSRFRGQEAGWIKRMQKQPLLAQS